MLEYILFFLQLLLLIYLVFLLFRKDPKVFKELIFFNVSILIWVLSILLITRIQDLSVSIWFARLTFFSTAIAVCTYSSFFSSYTKSKQRRFSLILNLLGIVMAILSLTPYLISSMAISEYSNYPSVVFGNVALLYVSFVVIAVSYLIYQVFSLRRTSSGLEYLQVSYITIGMTLAGIIAILTNVILPALTGSSASAFWGPVGISVLSAITTYTVTRSRLFGIKYLLGKTLYYLILILIPFLVFVILINLLSILNLNVLNAYTYLLVFGGTLTFIFLFLFLYRIIDEKFNPTVGFKSSGFELIKEEFLKNISTELNIEKLGISTLKAIDKIFDLKKSGVIIFNADNATIIYKKLHEFGEKPLDNRNLLQVIQYWDEIGHSTILTKDELRNQNLSNSRLERILSFMKNDEIDVVLPLNRKVHLNGVVVLGSKNNRHPFTIEDIHYLENLIVNSSVAFSRSILYGEVQELNQTLQLKVNDQTKELQIKVKQLEEARRKERDMIDIMGHELRTPATIVKLNAELLEGFTDDILSNKEKFIKYVRRIKDAVGNEIKLINTLLSSAKLEGDKIELNPEEVNIQSEIEMSIHGHEHSAKEKGIQILNNTDPNTPSIYADHARVIEVLNNLVDNAIKYTEQGSVTIESFFDENFVNINIKDTGSGMKQEDIAHLGKKFFRVGNYLDDGEGKPDVVRPGGTGLGLYVTFGLVEKMGGKITVESKIGLGSTFTFSLPRYTGQDSGKTKSKTNNMFERLGLQK